MYHHVSKVDHVVPTNSVFTFCGRNDNRSWGQHNDLDMLLEARSRKKKHFDHFVLYHCVCTTVYTVHLVHY
jgi:hypothetical protein